MELKEAILQRHAVRRYVDEPIAQMAVEELQTMIDNINVTHQLHLQLVLDEPKAFGSFLTTYGLFKGVRNYVALVGCDNDELNAKCGYYGEQIVLKMTQLTLNSCWVAVTYRKTDAIEVLPGERLVAVIAFGYGSHQGVSHKSKTREKVMKVLSGKEAPSWFLNGVDCALLAPTALNRQKFLFELVDDTHVRLTVERGKFTQIDSGIVKYHFEVGAGEGCFEWCS